MSFLDIEDEYYDTIHDRVPGVTEDKERIRKLKVLVDGDAEGYLLQIFTKNLIGPIFIEIIQRKDHYSFGEGNFGAAPTPGQPAIANGMSGANGVPASPSGHGAGGPSIAIVHDGTVPTQVQCQLSHGTAGSSPPARVQGGFTINEAAPALAQDLFKY